jgi:membrane fusion protein (multidrug efflux system)
MTVAPPNGAPGAALARVAELRDASRLRPHVLLVGFEGDTLDELRTLVEARFHMRVADDEAAALPLLEQHEVAVLCLGPRLPWQQGERLLSEARRRPEAGCAQIVVAAEDVALEELAGDEELFYLSRAPLAAADLAALVASAVEHSAVGKGKAEGVRLEPQYRTLLQDLTRFLATQPQVEAAEERIAGAVARLLRAERAFCLGYVELDGSPRHPESTTAGLAGFVARTGLPVLLDRAGRDPRYVQAIDGRRIGRDDRLLAVPVHGAHGRSLALLMAVRSSARPPFLPADREILELLEDQVAFYFRGLDLPPSQDIEDAAAPNRPQLYRREALRHYATGRRAEGDVIRVAPRWAAWTYWLLLAILVAGLLYGLFGTVREYATGPAVIRFDEGRAIVTASAPGTVSMVSARVGERVRSGQLLASLYGAEEVAELRRIEQKIESQLLQRLKNPADESTAHALIDLRAEQELARNNLEARSIRAPSEGTVGDVRVRAGQYLSPGDVIMTLHGGNFHPSVLALLPGQFRPLLERGMPLRLQLEGYRGQPQDLVVDEIGEEVIGPTEAARYLGSEISDAVRLNGPLVLVRARIEERSFEVDGRRFEYHDGMQGVAEIPVRSERIFLVLFPGLKTLLGSKDG